MVPPRWLRSLSTLVSADCGLRIAEWGVQEFSIRPENRSPKQYQEAGGNYTTSRRLQFRNPQSAVRNC